MTDNLPPLPTPARITAVQFCDDGLWFNADQMQAYARAALAQAQSCVPAEQDAANLLSRFERQWHRMGELWERCQGKGWPEIEGAEFNALRDEKAPATRAALLALLAASPQPKPVQPSDCEWTNCPRRVGDVCCNVCPGLAAQPEKDPLADDLFSVLFEIEQAIENGSCPWQIEAAFEAYEAARRLQLPDHGIAAPQPKD